MVWDGVVIMVPLCHGLCYWTLLTLVLLNPDVPCFANSVDSDQLASEEAN